MANQYKNEVIYNGQTLISLKEDTVTPNKVLYGETFHDRSGTPQTGSMITHNVYDGLDSTSTDDALSANMGMLLNGKIASFIGSATVKLSEIGITAVNNAANGWYYAESNTLPESILPSGKRVIAVFSGGYYYGDMMYDFYGGKIVCRSASKKESLNANTSVVIWYAG